MYQLHPSAKLQALFRKRPFQGGQPENAEFLFVGLDANYAADLERAPAFGSIVEYHDDGVAFWQRHRVHHPFLLPSYRGDGRRYHQKFARVGFKPEDAARVSFIELSSRSSSLAPTVTRAKAGWRAACWVRRLTLVPARSIVQRAADDNQAA